MLTLWFHQRFCPGSSSGGSCSDGMLFVRSCITWPTMMVAPPTRMARLTTWTRSVIEWERSRSEASTACTTEVYKPTSPTNHVVLLEA